MRFSFSLALGSRLGNHARARSIAERNLAAYRDLFDNLMFKYADGWVNVPTLGEGVGYPAWWLRVVGYAEGPPALIPQAPARR